MNIYCLLALGGLAALLFLLYALCRAAADRLTVPDGNEDHL